MHFNKNLNISKLRINVLYGYFMFGIALCNVCSPYLTHMFFCDFDISLNYYLIYFSEKNFIDRWHEFVKKFKNHPKKRAENGFGEKACHQQAHFWLLHTAGPSHYPPANSTILPLPIAPGWCHIVHRSFSEVKSWLVGKGWERDCTHQPIRGVDFGAFTIFCASLINWYLVRNLKA